MNEAAEITFGTAVRCEDRQCGTLRCAIVDRAALAVTHLVVDPLHPGEGRHLVPIGLVQVASGQGVELSCTRSQYDALDDAGTTEVLPGPTYEQMQQEQLQTMVACHIYGRQTSSMMVATAHGQPSTASPRVTHDNVPAGEGEVVAGQPVHATDGDIGHVHGLVVEAPGSRVTHILLAEGHLWGKKDVAIPIGAVKDVFEDGVFLSLTKDAVGALPAAPSTG